MEPHLPHVRYLPWVGPAYGDPSPLFDVPVLVVGESHYWYEGCTDDEHLTKGVFAERAFGAPKDHREFDKDIARAVLGIAEPDSSAHNGVWQAVAFYNYIRELLMDSSKRPTKKMFNEPEAWLAFREVLAALQPSPRCVLVFAKQVWDRGFPRFDRQDDDASLFVGCGPDEIGWYRTGNSGFALAVGLYHPSAWKRFGKGYQHWHSIIKRALDYAYLRLDPRDRC